MRVPRPSPTPAERARKRPRYANAALLEGSSGKRLDNRRSLHPGQIVRLRLDIGKLDPKSHVEKPQALPELPDIDLDIMVSSTDFAVAAKPAALDATPRPRVASGRFFLPADGGPATTPDGKRRHTFFLKAPRRARAQPAQVRIGYYYRNILVQSQQLTAHVGQPGGFTIGTDFTVSDDLTGLDRIPKRPRISMLTNANADGTHQIVLRHPDGDKDTTIAVKDSNLGRPIQKLRKVLESRAPTEAVRSPAELKEDLRRLARPGRDLYDQLPGQKPFAFFVGLLEHPEQYVVQVARPTTSSFVAPWNLIYGIPLTSGVTPEMCPLVEEWNGRSPLFEGEPRDCPHGPHTRDVLCPFGFWGYRYTIEQLASSDEPVTEITAAPDCTCVMGETLYRIGTARLAEHAKTLRKMLTAVLPDANLQEGKDRQTIMTLLGNDLPFVYFLCHGQRLNNADPNIWLAVGKNETITTSDVIGWPEIWYKTLHKLLWGDVRPLVFINACRSLAIEPETLVTYLDAFVGTGRAAGVIGTEVKVNQELAMDVAEKFFKAWLSGKETVETALRTIRMDYLRNGNLFGLVYTPYCWSELKFKKSG